MDRSRALSLALAVLAVLALSAAAATLNTTTESGEGRGVGEGEGVGVGESRSPDFGAPNASDAGGSLPRSPFPIGPLVLAVLALASLVSLYYFYAEHGVRGALGVVVVLVVLGALLALVLSALLGLSREFEGRFGFLGDSVPNVGGGGAPGQVSETASAIADPPVLLLALLGLVVLGAVALAVRASGDDERRLDVEAADSSGPDVTAVGRAAGRAADRIAADADATNEVYRAWREMTDHLDVDDPRSSTPAEFAAAAVDAGMARGDVDELTGLFAEVRYGDAPATDDRERRAVAALRRIEDEYAQP